MDTDLILVIGLALAVLSIPSVVSAFSDGRAPRASAWRIAGGQFYKVELKRRVTWERCFTCAACNHIFELVIVVVCFAMCAFSIALLRYDPKLRKQVDREAAEAGPATMYLIYGLFVLTFVLVLTTVRKLLQRWRKQSSDVFVSEV